MSKVYVLVDERLMAAKNAKRSRHPRHFVVAAYSTMKKAQEAANGYLEALSFAPAGNGWKQGKLKGEITKTESSGKKSDKYGSLHATYRDDEAVLGHLRILTLTVNQPPEDEIDYMTAETFGADEVAYAVMWEGKEDDNEGLIYGIEYMDGEEVSDVEWFATAKERDAELKSYVEEFGAETFGAESKFDKLAKEIAADYRKKGKSPEEAMEIGEATAAKIGRAKFGKKKFARMGKSAESVTNFKGEMKTLVQTYVELRYPDDLEMQDAIFENITSGKESVSLKEMQDYVATRSSWYAEIEAVNPSMAVIHNQNDDFVGSIEVLDDSDDPDSVEVFVNDDQMNEISSTNLYEDGQFWEDYDAETFNAERKVYVLRFSDPMRGGKKVENAFLSYEEAQEYIERYIRPYNDERIRPFPQHIATTITEETRRFDAETSHFGGHTTEPICTTYACRTEIGGTHKGSDAMRFLAFLNEIKNTVGISNISYEHIGDEVPFGVVVFKFDICNSGYKPTIAQVKAQLDNLRNGMILRGADYEDLHRPIQTLAEGDEPNEEWYMGAETFNAMSFKQWSNDEMNEELHGGQNMNFDAWLEDEVHTHGNIPLKEWGYEEEHDEPEHQHAESMMSEDYDTDEEFLQNCRTDINRQIELGQMYAINEEKRPEHCDADGNWNDGENFYTILNLWGQYHYDEDKAEKLLYQMFREEYPQYLEAETFEAKGIDTYAEPLDEIGNFYSGKKGMLKIAGLGALVSAGIWITKNKLLE